MRVARGSASWLSSHGRVGSTLDDTEGARCLCSSRRGHYPSVLSASPTAPVFHAVIAIPREAQRSARENLGEWLLPTTLDTWACFHTLCCFCTTSLILLWSPAAASSVYLTGLGAAPLQGSRQIPLCPEPPALAPPLLPSLSPSRTSLSHTHTHTHRVSQKHSHQATL